jgi:2-(1,2-epoxy-1,2-dihydrophenyl)acetyl-CoA isomerase
MTSREDLVRVDVDDQLATVSLTRADRANAMNADFFGALSGALDDVARRDDVRAVVLRGEGRHFCAGGDLDHPLFSEDDAAVRRASIEQAYTVTNRLLDLPFPVVCAVQGRCAGAALALVLACDLRVAADTAMFSLDFVRLGLSPDMGAGWLLTSTVGTGRALDLALTGELMPAQQALDWGIVTRLVPEPDLLATATSLARRLADHPRGGVEAIRRLVRVLPNMSRSEGFEAEIVEMVRLTATTEARDRLEAFRQRTRGASS